MRAPTVCAFGESASDTAVRTGGYKIRPYTHSPPFPAVGAHSICARTAPPEPPDSRSAHLVPVRNFLFFMLLNGSSPYGMMIQGKCVLPRRDAFFAGSPARGPDRSAAFVNG